MSNMKTEKKAEPKKRASRAKKQPTRDEALKMLLDASNELKQNIQDLKNKDIITTIKNITRINKRNID